MGQPIPYYKAEPKSNPDVLSIFTDYKSNIENLNAKTIHKFREYGRKDSPFYNEEHFFVDVLGLIPEGARGRIYKGWHSCTAEFFRGLPYPTYYGLDFGYSDDPVALVAIKSHNNRNFFHEIVYESGLTNPALAKLMTARGVNKMADIFADSAEPKSIQELKDLGFKKIHPAEKGPDSVKFGIKVVKSMVNFITEGSKNIWFENEEYKWQLDAEGNPTDEPIDKNNHAKDGLRYGVTGWRSLKKKGNFTVAKTAIQSPSDVVDKVNPLDWV